MAGLERVITSLAFNVVRQRASKALLVLKIICSPLGSLGVVLEGVTSARDSSLRTKPKRAYDIASSGPESGAAFTIVNQVHLFKTSMSLTSRLIAINVM